MSDDNTLRGEIESAMATDTAEVPAEESFEDFAVRSLANGASLEALNLVKLIETEFPYFQNQRNLGWALRALQHTASTNPEYFGSETDARSVLRKLQSIGEEADFNRAERSRIDRRLKDLGDVLTRTEALVASRRKH